MDESQTLPTSPSPAPAPADPTMVPFGPVAGLVFTATIRDLVRRRRLWLLGLVGLLPFFLAILWRQFGTELFNSETFFNNMVGLLYLQLLVPLVGLAFGVPTLNDEIEGRTLPYLLTRPVSRHAVFAGKLLAVQLLSSTLLALSLVACFMVMATAGAEALSFAFLKLYLGHVGIVLLGTMAYTSVFAIFGVLAMRPLLLSLFFWFGWETAVAKVPGHLQTWTLNFHLKNLSLGPPDVQQTLISFAQQLLSGPVNVPAWQSMMILLVVLAAAVALGGWVFTRKEYDLS